MSPYRYQLVESHSEYRRAEDTREMDVPVRIVDRCQKREKKTDLCVLKEALAGAVRDRDPHFGEDRRGNVEFIASPREQCEISV